MEKQWAVKYKNVFKNMIVLVEPFTNFMVIFSFTLIHFRLLEEEIIIKLSRIWAGKILCPITLFCVSSNYLRDLF